MERQWYWVTAIGKDKPGIVAALTTLLAQQGGNIEDASMSRYQQWFAMMLLVSFVPNEQPILQGLSATGLENLILHVEPIDRKPEDNLAEQANYRVSVYGQDRTGIVAKTAQAIYAAGGNIVTLDVDVAQQHMPEHLFVMVMDVYFQTDFKAEHFKQQLQEQLTMDVHVVALEGVVL